MRHLLRPFLILALSPLLAGCLGYREVVMRGIEDVEFRKLDARSVHLTAKVRLANPNGYAIKVKDPDVDIYLNGLLVGKGLLDTVVRMERRSDRVHVIPLHADYKAGNLLVTMATAMVTGQVKVKAVGTVLGKAGLLRKRYPFEVEETVRLYGDR
jgi:LEA14-like dessication related protein